MRKVLFTAAAIAFGCAAAAQEAKPGETQLPGPPPIPAPPPQYEPPAPIADQPSTAPEGAQPGTPPAAWPPPPPRYPPPPPAYRPPPPGAYPPPPPGAYPPQPPYWTLPPRHRDTWYIGFGIGSGGGSFTGPDGARHSFAGSMPGGASTAALNFKVGATLTPRLLLGFDLTAIETVGRTTTVCTGLYCYDTESSVGIVSLAAVATWFPVERGFFLRGGAGLGSYSDDVTVNGVQQTTTANGVGLIAGAGYAWWIGRTFNLTLGLDVLGQWYGKSDTAPKRASGAAVLLGFDWY